MQGVFKCLVKHFRSSGKIIGIIFPNEFTIHFTERGQKFHVLALRVIKHENKWYIRIRLVVLIVFHI